MGSTLKNIKTIQPRISKAKLVADLEKIITQADDFLKTVADIPESDKLMKKIVTDIKVGLERTRDALTQNSNIVAVKQWFSRMVGGNSSFKTMLDESQNDLTKLMNHMANHPDEYTQEALAALEEYKNSAFKAFYNRWHTMSHKEFTELITRAVAR